MDLISLYEYDPTGENPRNRVTNEAITVIPPATIEDFSYVCPRAAPFFAETIEIRDRPHGSGRKLVEDVDYRLVFDFVSASVHVNRRICVGIALLDPGYSGTLYITYQSLGGNYTLNDYGILEELIRQRYSSLHVAYEQIINLPPGFAPSWHAHQIKDMVGMHEVVTMLKAIEEAILARPGSYTVLAKILEDHLNSDHAHTPSEVGLGNVQNYGVATAADVKNGASDKYVTADILKGAIEAITLNKDGLITTDVLNAELEKLKQWVLDHLALYVKISDIGKYIPDVSIFIRKDDFYSIKTHYFPIVPLLNNSEVEITYRNLFGLPNEDNEKKFLTSRGFRLLTGTGNVTIKHSDVEEIPHSLKQTGGLTFTFYNGMTNPITFIEHGNGAQRKIVPVGSMATVFYAGLNHVVLVGGYIG